MKKIITLAAAAAIAASSAAPALAGSAEGTVVDPFVEEAAAAESSIGPVGAIALGVLAVGAIIAIADSSDGTN